MTIGTVARASVVNLLLLWLWVAPAQGQTLRSQAAVSEPAQSRLCEQAAASGSDPQRVQNCLPLVWAEDARIRERAREVYSSAIHRINIQRSGNRPQVSRISVPYTVQGACPHEGCQYGVWFSEQARPLFDSPNGKRLGSQIERGERVAVLTGILFVTPARAVVTRSFGNLRAGDTVLVLDYLGEGRAVYWVNGRYYADGGRDCPRGDCSSLFRLAGGQRGGGHISNAAQSQWWVKVQRRDGTQGWVLNDKGFEYDFKSQFDSGVPADIADPFDPDHLQRSALKLAEAGGRLTKTLETLPGQGLGVTMDVALQSRGDGLLVEVLTVDGRQLSGQNINAVSTGESFDLSVQLSARLDCNDCERNFGEAESGYALQLRNGVVSLKRTPITVFLPWETMKGKDLLFFDLISSDRKGYSHRTAFRFRESFNIGELIKELAAKGGEPTLPPGWFSNYRDQFLGGETKVVTKAVARERNFPTSIETKVLRELPKGTELSGRWVQGTDGVVKWFKRVDTGGYVWEGNLTSFVAPVPAQPRLGWGPDIVAVGEDVLGYNKCGKSVVPRDCWRSKGVGEAAIDFALAYSPDNMGEALGSEFYELGEVDLGVVTVLGAYFWEVPVLLNGKVGIFPVEPTSDHFATFRDAASRRMLARFPKAVSVWEKHIAAHRLLPDGTQRFVLVELVHDACHACKIIGTGITFVEVGPATNGRPVRKPIGLLLDDSPESDAELTAQVLMRRPQSLKMRLNTLGYDAGPMDAIPTARLSDALGEFQRERCLTVTGRIDASTASALIATDGLRSTPCLGPVLPQPPQPLLYTNGYAPSPQQLSQIARFEALGGKAILDQLASDATWTGMAKLTRETDAWSNRRTLCNVPEDRRKSALFFIDYSILANEDAAALYLQDCMEKLARTIGISIEELQAIHWARNAAQAGYMDYSQLAKQSFVPAPDSEKAFHVFGLDEARVEKWLGPDKQEYVFVRPPGTGQGDQRILQVFDGTNDGTYNIIPIVRDASGKRLPESETGHMLLDVLPWVLWGTSVDDRTDFETRRAKLAASFRAGALDWIFPARDQLDAQLARARASDKMLDLLENARLLHSIHDVVATAGAINDVDEAIRILSQSEDLRLVLKGQRLEDVKSTMRGGLYLEASGIIGNALIDQLYDRQEAQGQKIRLPREVAHALLDAGVNILSGDLLGQSLDTSITIWRAHNAHVELKGVNSNLLETVRQGALTSISLVASRPDDQRAQRVADSYSSDTLLLANSLASGITWATTVDTQRKINLVVYLHSLRIAQLTGRSPALGAGEIKDEAKRLDELPSNMLQGMAPEWLRSEKTEYRDFADEVARQFGIAGW